MAQSKAALKSAGVGLLGAGIGMVVGRYVAAKKPETHKWLIIGLAGPFIPFPSILQGMLTGAGFSALCQISDEDIVPELMGNNGTPQLTSTGTQMANQLAGK